VTGKLYLRKNMTKNFFDILKINKERSRIRSWIRIRTKMSRIPNTGKKLLSSYLPDHAEVLSRASPRPPASQLSPGSRLKETAHSCNGQTTVFALKSKQEKKES
jgi:hypothetical protein